MARVVVVTGGSGAIGAAIRQRFHAHGDRCVGLDTVPVADDAGPVLAADVADESAVRHAFDQIRSDFGAPEVLVNCAGMTGAGSVLDEPLGRWNRILEVNLTSVFLCCREVIADMATAQSGKIVNIASVNARFGGSALSGPAYAASKGGMLTLTRFLAVNTPRMGSRSTPWRRAHTTPRCGTRSMRRCASGSSR